jgi:hypothetical protein
VPRSGGWGLKCENRGADRGSLAKGGEEKSPYSPNFSTPLSTLLDVEHTIPLLLSDNVESPSQPWRSTRSVCKALRAFVCLLSSLYIHWEACPKGKRVPLVEAYRNPIIVRVCIWALSRPSDHTDFAGGNLLLAGRCIPSFKGADVDRLPRYKLIERS